MNFFKNKPEHGPAVPPAAAPTTVLDDPSTVFDNGNCAIVFVMGPPGSGKRSQCDNLVEKLKPDIFVHLSTTALLAKKIVGKQTELSKKICNMMEAHQPIPGDIVVPIIASAIRNIQIKLNGVWINFLISSFPRSADQLAVWNQQVSGAYVPCKIMLQCPLFTSKSRLSAPSGGSQTKKEIMERLQRYQEVFTPCWEALRADEDHKMTLYAVQASGVLAVVTNKLSAVLRASLRLFDRNLPPEVLQQKQSTPAPKKSKSTMKMSTIENYKERVGIRPRGARDKDATTSAVKTLLSVSPPKVPRPVAKGDFPPFELVEIKTPVKLKAAARAGKERIEGKDVKDGKDMKEVKHEIKPKLDYKEKVEKNDVTLKEKSDKRDPKEKRDAKAKVEKQEKHEKLEMKEEPEALCTTFLKDPVSDAKPELKLESHLEPKFMPLFVRNVKESFNLPYFPPLFCGRHSRTLRIEVSNPPLVRVVLIPDCESVRFEPEEWEFLPEVKSITIIVHALATIQREGTAKIVFQTSGEDADYFETPHPTQIMVKRLGLITVPAFPRLTLGVPCREIVFKVSKPPTSALTITPLSALIEFSPPSLTFTATGPAKLCCVATANVCDVQKTSERLLEMEKQSIELEPPIPNLTTTASVLDSVTCDSLGEADASEDRKEWQRQEKEDFRRTRTLQNKLMTETRDLSITKAVVRFRLQGMDAMTFVPPGEVVVCIKKGLFAIPRSFPVLYAGTQSKPLPVVISVSPVSSVSLTPRAHGLTFDPPSLTYVNPIQGVGISNLVTAAQLTEENEKKSVAEREAERTLSFTMSVQPQECRAGSRNIAWQIEGADAKFFLAPASSRVMVRKQTAVLVHPPQALVAGTDGSRPQNILTLVVSLPPRGLLTVRPLNDDLAFEPPLLTFTATTAQARCSMVVMERSALLATWERVVAGIEPSKTNLATIIRFELGGPAKAKFLCPPDQRVELSTTLSRRGEPDRIAEPAAQETADPAEPLSGQKALLIESFEADDDNVPDSSEPEPTPAATAAEEPPDNFNAEAMLANEASRSKATPTQQSRKNDKLNMDSLLSTKALDNKRLSPAPSNPDGTSKRPSPSSLHRARGDAAVTSAANASSKRPTPSPADRGSLSTEAAARNGLDPRSADPTDHAKGSVPATRRSSESKSFAGPSLSPGKVPGLSQVGANKRRPGSTGSPTTGATFAESNEYGLARSIIQAQKTLADGNSPNNPNAPPRPPKPQPSSRPSPSSTSKTSRLQGGADRNARGAEKIDKPARGVSLALAKQQAKANVASSGASEQVVVLPGRRRSSDSKAPPPSSHAPLLANARAELSSAKPFTRSERTRTAVLQSSPTNGTVLAPASAASGDAFSGMKAANLVLVGHEPPAVEAGASLLSTLTEPAKHLSLEVASKSGEDELYDDDDFDNDHQTGTPGSGRI